MDNLAVSRRNHTNKKGNKENTQPALGSKFPIKKDKTSAAPLKAKAKQAGTRPTSGEPLQSVRSVLRDGKRPATAVRQQHTHSQAFLTEQIVKHKKMVVEAPKPPASVASLKCAPGMYKGKVVQSKIGSIWKSSAAGMATNPKPSAPKPESQRVGNVAKSRSKSVEHDKTKHEKTRSKSVPSRPVQVPKAPASSHPPTRTIPATLTATRSTKMTVAPTKLSSKPKTSMTDKKINKAPVSSTLSQYRLTMESAEERRAKLADWLASKGKSLKRPAMAAPSKTSKVSAKPKANLQPPSTVEAQPPAQCEPEPSLEAQKPDSAAAALCADTQGAADAEHSPAPVMMNTSLDLHESSDADLAFDPQDSVEDIVVNLCNVLEALETPSRCSDESTQGTDECNAEMESRKPVDECKREELKNASEQVEDEAEESDGQKEETEEVESDDDDDDVIETTPQMEEASVIKYSVKTTPYLQSVKKTIEGEACRSASRKKSNIKDIKFLTPVRRSCRIQRKSSRLPAMLTDHDPCVSSLAELVNLDDDPNAYVVRKNTALLEDVLDQHTQ
ncbi:cytoskeleton-associated protein 2 [Parambassis ranga]|uniref:Cytoskeleton-associated protein 2 n=1 Tax=Parambassis ranga TaxID=210632 RepID=A0A6P7JKU2_9TELE|nr:cytoskeleton-associated protein 2-like [Parambassis ranga]